MKKQAFSAIIIATYVFFSFAIVSPLATLVFGNSIFQTIGLIGGAFLTLILTFISNSLPTNWQGIFSYLSDEDQTKLWFRLHLAFTYVAGVLLLVIATLCTYIPLTISIYKDAFPANFMLTGMALFFSVTGLWALNRLIGMGYRWFCKIGFLGIRSFSALAFENLEKKNDRGVYYLLSAITGFQEHLKRNQLENTYLTDVIKILRGIYVFKFEVPFSELKELAFATERLPSIEGFNDALQKFTECDSIKWSNSFKAIEIKKRPPFELIGVIAAVFAGLTFVPESSRSIILGYLSQWSIDNVLFIIGFCLFIGVAMTVSIDSDYKYNPLRENSPNKKIKKNEFNPILLER